ncbi:MAG: SDR family NAD(P)-dependent oxidoreductase [Thermodesulfobacteriota bacterium]
MAEHLDLNGKTALVTGAGRGLGRAMAVGLARAGARVVVTDLFDTTETLEEIGREGFSALGLHIDVSSKNDVQAMVKRVVDRYGSLNILVNNAVSGMDPAQETGPQEWGKTLCLNLKGQFLCAQATGRQMIRQGAGKIINIAGMAHEAAFVASAAYHASKTGLILLTKSLAAQWDSHNVQVNAICPGLADACSGQAGEVFLQTARSKVQLSRYGEPEELVGTAVYLSSGACGCVTGQALTIKSGRYAGYAGPRGRREIKKGEALNRPPLERG